MPGSGGSLRVVLLVTLVLLAGCGNGAVSPPTAGSDETTPTPRFVPTMELDQNISVVNDNRSTTYLVTVLAASGPLEEVRFTLTTGDDTVTRTHDIDQVGGFSIEGTKRVTDVSPVRGRELSEWSTVVRPRSAVSLPLSVENENATYLLVYHERWEGTRVDVLYRDYRCDSGELWRLRFRVHEGASTAVCGD